METLVRRLGRIFTRKKQDEIPGVKSVTARKIERLERNLSRWKEEKGWRKPILTVTETAESLGTDSVTFFHYFEERIGMDFRTWRTRLRIEDAQRLMLEEPETAVSTIARRVGFSDRSNFSRQFARYTGRTPGQWRKEAGISHDIPAPENDYV